MEFLFLFIVGAVVWAWSIQIALFLSGIITQISIVVFYMIVGLLINIWNKLTGKQ